MDYISIVESIRRNGDRHHDRAKMWLTKGLGEYAAGSMRKAERNYKRAKELEGSPSLFLRALIDDLSQKIAAGIFGRGSHQ